MSETRNRSIQMLELLNENGFDLMDLILLLKDLDRLQMSSSNIKTTTNIEKQVSKTLIGLGINPNIKGFKYCKIAILECYKTPELSHELNSKLFPSIAAQYNTSGKNVDRAIRTAINYGFNRKDEPDSLWKKYFEYNVSSGNRPCTAPFLATIVEQLKLDNM